MKLREMARIWLVTLIGTQWGCSADLAYELGPVYTPISEGASNPTVAIDAHRASVYVAWVQTEEGVSNVYLSRASGPESSFTPPVRVNHRPGDAAPHEQAPAQVAVGPEGNVYVVWQTTTPIEGRRFPASDLRFARSTDGGRSFEPTITVNDDAGGPPASHTFHNIAVGPDGTVYVSWIDSRNRASSSDPPEDSHGGSANGNALVHHDSVPGPDIRIARSTDGGRSFEPSVIVDRGACPCCRTALAVSRDGKVYAAWRKVFEGNVRDIVLASSNDGARTFTPPVRVHEDGWVFAGCPHTGPGLAIDDAGRVHIAWYTGADRAIGLYYAAAEESTTGFAPPAVLVKGPVPVSQVKLAASGPNVFGVWEDRREAEPRVQFAGALPGRNLNSESLTVGSGTSPAVAAAGGLYAVAWLDGGAVRVRMGRIPKRWQ
jgi:hypothetical protein